MKLAVRLLSMLLVFVSIEFAYASGIKQLAANRKVPLHIKADKLEAFDKKGLYKLIGNVVVTQGDMQLSADKMDIYRNPKNGDIEKIICVGNVVMKKDGKTATADKAIYDDKEQKVTLVGHAVVTGDGNTIKSDEIIYYLARDYAVASSRKAGGVKVTINPKSNAILKLKSGGKKKEKK